jgi:hypothetical protein
VRRVYVAFVVVCVAACSHSGSDARSTAEAFLDAHYVRIDLEGAKEHAAGLARDKIEKEIELTKDQEIDSDTHQPRVNYRLHRGDESPNAAQFAYELTIRVSGTDPFAKLVMVTVRKQDGAWTVTNYSESDMPGPG